MPCACIEEHGSRGRAAGFKSSFVKRHYPRAVWWANIFLSGWGFHGPAMEMPTPPK
jgi:hypothetical protein